METGVTVLQAATDIIGLFASVIGKFTEPPLIYVLGLTVAGGAVGLTKRLFRR